MFFKRAKKSEPAVETVSAPSPAPAASESGPRYQPLEPDKLRRSTKAATLGFKSTADVSAPPEPFEAKRVLEALRAALAQKSAGRPAHMFVSAPRQSGAATFLAAQVSAMPSAVDKAAADWVWVRASGDAKTLTPLALAAGEGKRFADGVRAVVAELRATLPYLLSGEDFLTRRAAIEAGFAAVRDDAFARLRAAAAAQNVAILTTQMGYAVAPLHEGKVVKLDVLNRLPDAMRSEVRRKVEAIEAELQTLLADVPIEAKTRAAELAELTADYIRPAVTEAFSGLAKEFSGSLAANAFLNAAQAEILSVAGRDPLAMLPDFVASVLTGAGKEASSTVIADGADLGEALIRAGNGTVVVDADRLVADADAWAQMTKVLSGRGIVLRALSQSEPVPFAGSVVLVGEPSLAERLDRGDTDFATLAPLRAAFAAEAARSDETEQALARSIAHASAARRHLPLDAAAVAHAIGEAARATGRPDRLSGDLTPVLALLRDASRLAQIAGRATVTEGDVEAAYAERAHGVQSLFAAAGPGVMGRVVAVGLGPRPVEVWATVRSGPGRAADIARAGPASVSGLLWSHLAARYVPQAQLAFSAALVHEPPVDAAALERTSGAELCALLSALAEAPVAKSAAVAGWASPAGTLLPIADLNAAIEAAYDHAAPRDATNPLVIVIARANEADLMLRSDLVEAARKGRLQVFAVETIEDALAVLTLLPSGARSDATSSYPEGSLNRMIDDRLAKFARRAAPETTVSPAAVRAGVKPVTP